MSNENESIQVNRVKITDTFWLSRQEVLADKVIPYQWKALNDQLPDAEPSYCIHNFKAAANLLKEHHQGRMNYTNRGFAVWPEDRNAPKEDEFYGFVFQDSDLYKWIEAVSYSLISRPNAELEQTVDEVIELISRSQQENGYLDTYYILNGMDKALTNLKDHHELYCFGHLVEAAVAYANTTGKQTLLNVAMRYADFLVDHFGYEEGKNMGYPGHEIAEMALVKLYEATSKDQYKELAQFFVDERGKRPYYFDEEQGKTEADQGKEDYSYFQAHLPVREQTEIVGHAVRAMYLLSGMADLAKLNDDKELFDACKHLWDNMENEKMYITGGVGGTHIGEAFSYPFDLPNDSAYAETCASIGLCFFAIRMLKNNPDSHYSDAMERALYNTVLSGMALDGESFFYVNPLEVNPEACAKDERLNHVKPVRQKWFGCACCPPNIARLLGSLGGYIYTENETTLFTHLYISSEIAKQVAGEELQVALCADLQRQGTAKLLIQKAPASPCTIAVRIPSWSCATTVSCHLGQNDFIFTIENGIIRNQPDFICMKEGYVYVNHIYLAEDKISLQFDLSVNLIQASTRVREDIGKVAVQRGPQVYCVEECDNQKDLHRLRLSTSEPLSATIKEMTIGGEVAQGISLPGKFINESHEGTLYHRYEPRNEQEVIIHFVPYALWGNRGEGEMSVWIRE